ncbi:hypothetical protein [Staphylococcus americanisciuri]|uniref:Uncharacterized protein n=1 Tax=Staphylococcus americanisciuri TaxID=2973940 RepID=A0ABT2EZY0_9STAP|nr:hypothetical protein [Staphylococcus americanisciuri]MCS4485761.1 hypothetical protein [Staphylococcus americanisciuri]
MNKSHLFKRKISKNLERELYQFINVYKNNELSTPEKWKVFYKFVNSSFLEKQSRRYCISQLALIFQESGIQPSPFIKVYAHGLYILALYNDFEIYNEGFNI